MTGRDPDHFRLVLHSPHMKICRTVPHPSDVLDDSKPPRFRPHFPTMVGTVNNRSPGKVIVRNGIELIQEAAAISAIIIGSETNPKHTYADVKRVEPFICDVLCENTENTFFVKSKDTLNSKDYPNIDFFIDRREFENVEDERNAIVNEGEIQIKNIQYDINDSLISNRSRYDRLPTRVMATNYIITDHIVSKNKIFKYLESPFFDYSGVLNIKLTITVHSGRGIMNRKIYYPLLNFKNLTGSFDDENGYFFTDIAAHPDKWKHTDAQQVLQIDNKQNIYNNILHSYGIRGY